MMISECNTEARDSLGLIIQIFFFGVQKIRFGMPPFSWSIPERNRNTKKKQQSLMYECFTCCVDSFVREYNPYETQQQWNVDILSKCFGCFLWIHSKHLDQWPRVTLRITRETFVINQLGQQADVIPRVGWNFFSVRDNGQELGLFFGGAKTHGFRSGFTLKAIHWESAVSTKLSTAAQGVSLNHPQLRVQHLERLAGSLRRMRCWKCFPITFWSKLVGFNAR